MSRLRVVPITTTWTAPRRARHVDWRCLPAGASFVVTEWGLISRAPKITRGEWWVGGRRQSKTKAVKFNRQGHKATFQLWLISSPKSMMFNWLRLVKGLLLFLTSFSQQSTINILPPIKCLKNCKYAHQNFQGPNHQWSKTDKHLLSKMSRKKKTTCKCLRLRCCVVGHRCLKKITVAISPSSK